MSNVPMSFFPLDASRVLARPLLGLGSFMKDAFRDYAVTLKEADIYVTPNEFFSIALLNTIIWWLITSGILIIIFNLIHIPQSFIMGPIVGLPIAILVLVRIILSVQLTINKKVKSIDSNLVFGLKMMLVEIDAGVSLFDAIVLVASYRLGGMSSAFKEIAKRLNSGESEEEVLKDVALKNPSSFLKKTLWQVVSGLRVGSPLGQVIGESLDALEREQRNEIIEYGSSLRVFTLIFMMVGAIIPAMGLAFLIVINSLPGVSIGKEVTWGLVGITIVCEIMLIGFIKSKRPSLVGSI